MMPVGTPPNAIVFGTGLVKIPQMIRAGFLLNVAGIVIVTAFAYLVIGPLRGIRSGAPPKLARVHLRNRSGSGVAFTSRVRIQARHRRGLGSGPTEVLRTPRRVAHHERHDAGVPVLDRLATAANRQSSAARDVMHAPPGAFLPCD
jgi:hypothetical protein